MKEQISELISLFLIQKDKLIATKAQYNEQLIELKRIRNKNAMECIKTFLPDLSSESIKKCKDVIPSFLLPTVVKKWGFIVGLFTGEIKEEIQPGVSLEMIHLKMGAYLDNCLEQDRPPLWSAEVSSFDSKIEKIQLLSIYKDAQEIEEITKAIESLEKIKNIDFNLLKPTIKEKYIASITSQVKDARNKRFSYQRNMNLEYRGVSLPVFDINTNSGLSLLHSWFWYEMIVNGYDYILNNNFVAGGGLFDGGGASGSYSEDTSTAPSGSGISPINIVAGVAVGVAGALIVENVLDNNANLNNINDSTTQIVSNADDSINVSNPAFNDNIESHYALGANNFS